VERQAYLAALYDTLHGVEAARVVLARACRRIEDEARVRPDVVALANENEGDPTR
jgi:hypothetical protein